jgi:hypothetical protein
MVVLAAAICTKNGKALLSRQFVELSKVRIEGLLAAFPKLMGTGKQHTFIETDSVRYVYQPMETLYILLITNKNSNILEDLETLRLLAKLVPEYCHILEEAEIMKYAFDLVFAFDEVIAMGYKERVTVQQVKHFTTMESHEEERARVEQHLKEVEAKKKGDEKRKQLDKKRAEERKLMGDSHGHGHGVGLSAMGAGSGSGVSYAEAPQPFVEKKEPQPALHPARSSKGMVLGGKTSKKTALAQVLKEEKIVEHDEEVDAIVEAGSSVAPAGGSAQTTPTESVHIVIEEQLVVQVENDGGLQSMEIKGGLSVTVFDTNIPRVKVIVRQGDNRQFQFKTHPNIDKQAFTHDSIIKLKDSARAFPTSTPAGVLKWRMQTRDEAMLPLTVSCWPSAGSDGQTYVTLEYELLVEMELQNVSIAIPVPPPSTHDHRGAGLAPVVSRVEGHYDWDARSRTLFWRLPIVDQSNKNGSMEFSIPSADPKAFFPLQVTFSASRTFCDIQVVEVLAEGPGGDSPVKHSEVTQVSTEQFEIV